MGGNYLVSASYSLINDMLFFTNLVFPDSLQATPRWDSPPRHFFDAKGKMKREGGGKKKKKKIFFFSLNKKRGKKFFFWGAHPKGGKIKKYWKLNVLYSDRRGYGMEQT